MGETKPPEGYKTGIELEPPVPDGGEAKPKNESAILSPEEKGRILTELERIDAEYRATSDSLGTAQDQERALSVAMKEGTLRARSVRNALERYTASIAEVTALKAQADAKVNALTVVDKIAQFVGIQTKRAQAAGQLEEQARGAATYHENSFPPSANPGEWAGRVSELEKELTSLQVRLDAVRAEQQTLHEKLNGIFGQRHGLNDKMGRSTFEEQRQRIIELWTSPDGGRALREKAADLDRLADPDREWTEDDYALAEEHYPRLSRADLARLRDEAIGEA